MKLYQDGRVKAIGVSGFTNARLLDLTAHNEVSPAVNQIEAHPFYQQVESADYMKENGVQMQAWGPLAQGRHNIHENEVLAAIGAKYGKTVAQVSLRWLIQRGISAIPKSVKKERMAENFNIFDFELSQEDMATIATLETGQGLVEIMGEAEMLAFMLDLYKDFKHTTKANIRLAGLH